MAGSQIERAFGLLETLTSAPEGMALQSLADQLQIPKSAAHRMLSDLIRLGYVRQEAKTSHYRLSTKLVAMGFRYLSHTGLDVVQPILDRLAADSGELVRVGVIEEQRLTWIVKAQGAKAGLRYDPDMGREAPLASTASGQAWLSSLTDEQAQARVLQQGWAQAVAEAGPNAPQNMAALLERLALARQRGYAAVVESASVGTAAMAVPIPSPRTGETIGVLSITGPSARFTLERMQSLAPALWAARDELSAASLASEFFT